MFKLRTARVYIQQRFSPQYKNANIVNFIVTVPSLEMKLDQWILQPRNIIIYTNWYLIPHLLILYDVNKE